MNIVKRLLSIALIIIFVFSMVGCKKKADDGFLVFNHTQEPTIIPVATPKPEGSTELKVVMPKKISSTNPFRVNSRDLTSLYNLIFEPLIKFNEIGEPVPVLAQKFEVNESGKKWTITIRDDVFWHGNGRKVDAYDVEYTLDLMKQLRQQKELEFHGCEAIGYLRHWSVENERTIKIYSHEPFYGTLNALDFPVLPKDGSYSLQTEPLYPVGTGPYQVESWNPGEEVTLKLNPNWWQKKLKIDRIIAKPFDDNAVALSALSLNQIDITQTDEITLLASEQSREIFSYEYTTNYYEYLLPNLSSTGLGDERVRQAIAHALDRNEIVSNVYVNHAILVDTPVPPTSYLYTGKLLTYDNDVDQAKRLMKLAGWKHTDEDPWLDVDPDGNEMDYTLTLLTNNDNDSPQRYEAATFIKRQLEKIGIKVEIKAEDWDIYKSMVNEGRFDLLLAGRYLSDIPDLRSMLKSDGIRNSSGYKNAEMDDLLIAVMESKTRESIEKNYEKLQQKIVDDVPIISLYFRTHTLLTRNNIVGVTHVTEDNAFASINTWDKR